MKLKNLKLISLFLAGIVLVATIIFNWPSIKGIVKADDATSANGSLVLYDDQLNSNVNNWSWNSSIDLNVTNPVYEGSKSIAFTPSAWGALYLHTDTAIDLTQYSALHFSMLPNASGQQFSLLIYDTNNQVKATLPLSKYNSNLASNIWNSYSIPVSDMLSSTSSIKGIALQETSGKSQPVVYIDSVQFVKSTNNYQIYGDNLKSDWTNWSWDSSIQFDSSYPTYEGNNAISFAPAAAWGGLYLHTDAGVDTTPFTTVTFAAKASADGAKFALMAYDGNNQLLNNPLPLDNYGGQPVTSTWKVYAIPLSDLHADHKTVKGFGLNDLSGHSQPVIYIDAIELTSGNQTLNIQSVTPTVSITPTSIPSLTVTPSISPTASPNITPTSTPSVSTNTLTAATSGNPLSGMTFFNDPDTNSAAQQVKDWESSRSADAQMINKIATQPKAIWLGGWNSNIQGDTQAKVDKASQANKVPVFIAYNIPFRDCGSYSAGGSSSADAYRTWIDGMAAGIGSRKAAVVLEPDALAGYTCLPSDGQQQRLDLLKYAVQKLKSLGNTLVYLDAGNSSWVSANDMAQRLKQAGIDMADGFSLNVSNFRTNDESISYGQQISSQIGGKHFVIDTSRNGNGPASDNAWCNPDGSALGNQPTTNTGNPLVDAFLWLKYPGQSDGNCNGAPSAGVWYPDYALGLAQRARW